MLQIDKNMALTLRRSALHGRVGVSSHTFHCKWGVEETEKSLPFHSEIGHCWGR